MPREVRRRILYCLILAFLVLGSTAVLYAQGWRLSLQPFGLGKVGGIYIRTFPTDAAVSLSGKNKERKLGLFEKGTLLSNILPGVHEVQVSSPGFRTWKMPVEVKSALVTSLQNVVLVPDSSVEATSTPVKDIFLAGTTLLLSNASGTQTLSGLTVRGDEILAGSDDGTMLISYSAASREYFATDVPRATSTAIEKLAVRSGGKTALSFQPVPKDNTLFLAKGPSGLSLLRVPGGETLLVTTSSAISAAAAPGKIIWATFDTRANASFLSSYDIQSRNRNANFEFIPGRITSILAQESGDIFVITKEGILYSLNPNQASRVRLDRTARAATLSKSGDKLAVLDADGARVLILHGNKPDIILHLPDAATVQRLIWYKDGEHLLVQYQDKVVFLDLIDLQLQNTAVTAQSTRAEYEPEANSLYFIKDGLLKKVDFPNS